jgi:hypothetical protein
LAGESQTGQQARQAKDVVAVHVGNEDSPQLGHPQRTAQKLVLGAFPAVEQPELGALGKAHGH